MPIKLQGNRFDTIRTKTGAMVADAIGAPTDATVGLEAASSVGLTNVAFYWTSTLPVAATADFELWIRDNAGLAGNPLWVLAASVATVAVHTLVTFPTYTASQFYIKVATVAGVTTETGMLVRASMYSV